MSNPQDPPRPTPCISLCETVNQEAGPAALSALLSTTCWEAGFPGCERIYVGSYFCENFFLSATDEFHDAIAQLCATYDMQATLVVPIAGQAFLDRTEARLRQLLEAFHETYDEVVVNDIAAFLFASEITDVRIGMGRLFQKAQRDARYADVQERNAVLSLSPEAIECADVSHMRRQRPLVEVDPVSDIVDAGGILQDAPDAEIAIHLPYCFATTGHNCVAASTTQDVDEKFRLGRECSLECLRMTQETLTREGASYLKHGRTYYFANPLCQLAGVNSWRIVYAAAHETMRPAWQS